MSLRPVSLSLDEHGELIIAWNDGQRRKYRVAELRDTCPCATCREKRTAPKNPGLLPVLALEETKPVTISAMNPVGNYAYGIVFSDGHDTGIFTLHALSQAGIPLDPA